MNAKIVLRVILTALVILLIVVAAGLRSRSVRRAAFQRGVVYASWRHGEYSSAESDTTLSQNIKPIGVNWISIVVTCYQASLTATEIQCDSDRTPTDDDLRHAIQTAHDLGLQVMLKPHVDLDDADRWRDEIDLGGDESAWKAWFQSYTDFITHYAALAQVTGADYLVIGTELGGTSKRADDWRRVIKAVRRVYTGPITYAANHDGEEAEIYCQRA